MMRVGRTAIAARTAWLVWLAAAAAAEAAAEDAPLPVRVGVIIEAESPKPESDCVIIDDPLAFGGKAVSSRSSWQPVFESAVPEAEGELSVWVRYRGAPVCLKTVSNGRHAELGWQWGSPPEFAWVMAGRRQRVELGDRVLFIRSAKEGGGSDPVVDCAVFLSEADVRPERLPGYAEPVPPPVEVTVDWAKRTGSAGPMAYGLNACKGFDAGVTSNAKFREGIAYMGPGLIRFHSWEMLGDGPNGWLDHANRRWDRGKIAKALDGFPPAGTAALINIPGAPDGWFAKEGPCLARNEYGRFAAYCAELVKIVNVDLRRDVKYWEVTNEWDDAYWVHPVGRGEAGHVKELAELFVTCARAMKKVDPTIRAGGPAAARPDFVNQLRGFVRAAGDELDFLSYHAYACGSADTPDHEVYDRAQSIADMSGELVKMLSKESPGRRIEAHLNEYNVSWTWETRDERMRSHKGAVFDALVLIGSASGGADATNAWNDVDGTYGKLGEGYSLRPAAHVFRLSNGHFVGEIVKTTSSAAKAIVPFAVKSAGGGRAVALVNRTGLGRRVRLASAGRALPAELEMHRVSDTGYAKSTVSARALASGEIVLPAHSVTVALAPE